MQYAGRAVRVLLDYVGYVPICSKLKMVLQKHKEWPEICDILGKKEKQIDDNVYMKRYIIKKANIVQLIVSCSPSFF